MRTRQQVRTALVALRDMREHDGAEVPGSDRDWRLHSVLLAGGTGDAWLVLTREVPEPEDGRRR